MSAGSALWTGISSVSPDMYEASLFTLRHTNSLVPAVTVFNDLMGMNPRKVTSYPSVSWAQQTEGQATASEGFAETLLATLTPASYMAVVDLSDQRFDSDDQNTRANIAREVGAGAASYIDTSLAALFNQLTAGTIGAAGGTLSWNSIAYAIGTLRAAKVPAPYYCVLGEGQWTRLITAATITGSAFAAAPNTQDRLIDNWYTSPMFGGVTFITLPVIGGAAGTAGTAAVFSPAALAYDERTALSMEIQRQSKKRVNEMVAYMDFAVGVWAAARGVTLIGTDTIPTS